MKNNKKWIFGFLTTAAVTASITTPIVLFYNQSQGEQFVLTKDNIIYDEEKYVTFEIIDVPNSVTDIAIPADIVEYMPSLIPEAGADFRTQPFQWSIEIGHNINSVYLDASNLEWQDQLFGIGDWFITRVKTIIIDLSNSTNLTSNLELYQDEYGNPQPGVFRNVVLECDLVNIEINFPKNLQNLVVGIPTKYWPAEKTFISKMTFKNISENPNKTKIISQIKELDNAFQLGDLLQVL